MMYEQLAQNVKVLYAYVLYFFDRSFYTSIIEHAYKGLYLSCMFRIQ